MLEFFRNNKHRELIRQIVQQLYLKLMASRLTTYNLLIRYRLKWTIGSILNDPPLQQSNIIWFKSRNCDWMNNENLYCSTENYTEEHQKSILCMASASSYRVKPSSFRLVLGQHLEVSKRLKNPQDSRWNVPRSDPRKPLVICGLINQGLRTAWIRSH